VGAAMNFCAAIIVSVSAYVGEWLSLVEHLVRDQGVGGSNPLSPTNYRNPVIELASFRFPSFLELESTSGEKKRVKQALARKRARKKIRRDSD
jgi:hypothetical protein